MARIKKTNKSTAPMNQERVREILKCKDPLYFIKTYCKVSHPTKGLIDFRTYPYQDECVDAFTKYRFVIVNKSRQLGLSTVSAAYSLWLALFHKEKNVLVIATDLGVATNFMKKVFTYLENLPPWIILPKMVKNTQKEIRFSNGSQIKAIPTTPSAGRSEAVSLLILDETAHIENVDDIWLGLSPTLSCVAADTLVLTDNGFQKIEDFFPGNHKPGDYFEMEIPIFGMNGMELTSHGYVSPNHETLVVTTALGYEVEVTPIHPLLTQNHLGQGEMLQAQYLKLGDTLRIQCGMNKFGTEDWTDLAIHALVDVFDGLKELPRNLLQGNRASVTAFLNRLYSSPTAFYARWEKCISIKSQHKESLKQIQQLLLNIGLASKLYQTTDRDKWALSTDIVVCENFEMYPEVEPFFWDPIVSIQKSTNITYDFTVPETHSFLQNCILGSNTGGSAIMISTPCGVGNLFHKIWVGAHDKTNDFYAIELPWTVHPEHDQSWFEKESDAVRAAKGERGIAQEFLCSFLASGDTFIKPEYMELLEKQVKPPIAKHQTYDDLWIWKHAEPDHKYLVSMDVARGDAFDYSTAMVFDITTDEMVAEYKGKIPPDKFAELAIEIGMNYNMALLCPENNGPGLVTATDLKKSGYQNLFYEKLHKNAIQAFTVQDVGNELCGITTQAKNRDEMLVKLENILRNGFVKIPSERYISELKTFVYKGNRAQAMKGYNDDLVMCSAIGMYLFESSQKSIHNEDDIRYAMLAGMSANSAQVNSWGYNNVNNGASTFVSPVMTSTQLGQQRRLMGSQINPGNAFQQRSRQNPNDPYWQQWNWMFRK